MLNLAAPSDPCWLARARAGMDEVLLDHAHCEKKAASTALSLVFKYPERPGLAAALAALYRGLVASEARHHETYVRLAAGVAPDPDVRARLRELARHEAAVLAAAPPLARLHT